MDKSHVGMGQMVCPICMHESDNVVLLDKRLKNTLKPIQFAGWKPCKEHQEQLDDDFVALIETTTNAPKELTDKGRTGKYAMIKSHAFESIFSQKATNKIVFVEVGVLQKLEEMVQSE